MGTGKIRFDEIFEYLMELSRRTVQKNRLNLNDQSIMMEDVVGRILGRLLNIKFENLNYPFSAPGADLIDTTGMHALQVTAQTRNSKEKKADCIDKFIKSEKYTDCNYLHLVFFGVNKANQAFLKRENIRENCTYEGYDLLKLSAMVQHAEPDVQESIANILSYELGFQRITLQQETAWILAVNVPFLNGVRKDKPYSRHAFFSGKQTGNCQWYGILEGYARNRTAYPRIRRSIISSFESTSGACVTALIHGIGGCGKSTLLRQLAIDFAESTEIQVFWIRQRGLGRPSDDLISYAAAHPEFRFLIFIEDWYRLSGEFERAGQSFLKNLEHIPNVRVVIGDRDLNGKAYRLHTDPDNIYHLRSSENKKIIRGIVGDLPAWKTNAAQLFANNRNAHTSLFIILFVLVSYDERKRKLKAEDLSDLGRAARAIVHADMLLIYRRYPGMAKAIFYWASVYEQHKIFITYETFINTAEGYDAKSDIGRDFYSLRRNSEVHDILNRYINEGFNYEAPRRFKEILLLQFNHDRIPEDLISKQSFKDIPPFNDIEKKRFLDLLLKKADPYSASVVLMTFLNMEQAVFKDHAERLAYINQQFMPPVNNRNFEYMRCLRDLKLPAAVILSYINELYYERLFHAVLTVFYFNIASAGESEQLARRVLTDQQLNEIPADNIVAAFKVPGLLIEKTDAAHRIFSQYGKYEFHAAVLFFALPFLNQESLRQKTLNHILSNVQMAFDEPELYTLAFRETKNVLLQNETIVKMLGHPRSIYLHHTVINGFFGCPGAENEKISFAIKLLMQDDLLVQNQQTMIRALDVLKDNSIVQEIVSGILNNKCFFSFLPDFILKAFNICRDQKLRDQQATTILQKRGFYLLNSTFVFAGFEYCSDLAEKQNAALKILRQRDFYQFNHVTIAPVLKYGTDAKLMKKMIRKVLRDNRFVSKRAATFQLCFKYASEAEKIHVSKRIFFDENFLKTNPSIIYLIYPFVPMSHRKLKTCETILKHNDLLRLPWELLSKIFAEEALETAKFKFCHDLLGREDIAYIPPTYVRLAFGHAGNEKLMLEAAQRIITLPRLNLNYQENIEIALSYLPIGSDIFKLVDHLLSNVFKQPLRYERLYSYLLRHDFEASMIWRDRLELLFEQWQALDIRLLNDILFNDKINPEKTAKIGKILLQNWKTEILRPVKFTNGKIVNGRHLLNAMRHPANQQLVMKIATEIITCNEKKELPVPDDLLLYCQTILQTPSN